MPATKLTSNTRLSKMKFTANVAKKLFCFVRKKIKLTFKTYEGFKLLIFKLKQIKVLSYITKLKIIFKQ